MTDRVLEIMTLGKTHQNLMAKRADNPLILDALRDQGVWVEPGFEPSPFDHTLLFPRNVLAERYNTLWRLIQAKNPDVIHLKGLGNLLLAARVNAGRAVQGKRPVPTILEIGYQDLTVLVVEAQMRLFAGVRGNPFTIETNLSCETAIDKASEEMARYMGDLTNDGMDFLTSVSRGVLAGAIALFTGIMPRVSAILFTPGKHQLWEYEIVNHLFPDNAKQSSFLPTPGYMIDADIFKPSSLDRATVLSTLKDTDGNPLIEKADLKADYVIIVAGDIRSSSDTTNWSDQGRNIVRGLQQITRQGGPLQGRRIVALVIDKYSKGPNQSRQDLSLESSYVIRYDDKLLAQLFNIADLTLAITPGYRKIALQSVATETPVVLPGPLEMATGLPHSFDYGNYASYVASLLARNTKSLNGKGWAKTGRGFTPKGRAERLEFFYKAALRHAHRSETRPLDTVTLVHLTRQIGLMSLSPKLVANELVRQTRQERPPIVATLVEGILNGAITTPTQLETFAKEAQKIARQGRK